MVGESLPALPLSPSRQHQSVRRWSECCGLGFSAVLGEMSARLLSRSFTSLVSRRGTCIFFSSIPSSRRVLNLLQGLSSHSERGWLSLVVCPRDRPLGAPCACLCGSV